MATLGSSSDNGMIVAPESRAAMAGRDILAEGGNAVEAAVAVAAAIAASYPHMNSIGGDGFWLILRPDGKVIGIDASGRAAAAADRSLYEGHAQVPWRGPLAANTVAGAVSGWALALASYGGRVPLERLLAPAIEFAQKGVEVSAGGAAIAAARSAELRVLPGDYARVFEPGGRPLREGETLRQQELAETLRRLATGGLDSFYRGTLAEDIAGDLADLGSPLSADDLARHRAAKTEPLVVPVAGARLFNHRPPTQGMASLMILALADRLPRPDAESFAHLHYLVEATKQAFLWRDANCGDPEYMPEDPQDLLQDTGRLDAMAARIDRERALPWPQPARAGDTVWFGAADREGWVVSCIQSTYFEFGSGLVLPRTGICWQNRGASFTLAKGGWNALEPGRKPFHTLNPALAAFDDGRVLAYGAMGGEGQPQTQAAIFTRYANHAVPLAEAIARPRWLLGRTWGEESATLKLEEGIDPKVCALLAEAGHEVEMVSGCNAIMGHAGAIVRTAPGTFEGASDPRCDGMAAGW